MTDARELIEVIQDDREAASSVAARVWNAHSGRVIQEGRHDDFFLVQAFARHRTRAQVTEAKRIVDLYFAPWGAAKGEEWEEISGDQPFEPEVALRLIQKALSTGGDGR